MTSMISHDTANTFLSKILSIDNERTPINKEPVIMARMSAVFLHIFEYIIRLLAEQQVRQERHEPWNKGNQQQYTD